MKTKQEKLIHRANLVEQFNRMAMNRLYRQKQNLNATSRDMPNRKEMIDRTAGEFNHAQAIHDALTRGDFRALKTAAAGYIVQNSNADLTLTVGR